MNEPTPRTDAARKRAAMNYQVLYPATVSRPVNDCDMSDLEIELQQTRNELRVSGEALKEAQFMLDMSFNIPFMPVQEAQEGSPKDMVEKALLQPITRTLLEGKE